MYKYRIHYLLRQLSYDDYTIAMKWIPEKLNISQSTWRKWIYIKKNDPREISISQLQVLATFFECEVKDLINKKSSLNLREMFNKK